MSGKTGFQRRKWIWIMLMVDIVFMLLLLTLGIIALQVSGGLQDNVDVVFIVPYQYDFNVTDSAGKRWDGETKVDIFQASYVNGEGVVTVQSQNGSSVFAPGTTTTYAFAMYNSGNAAVSGETNIGFQLLTNGTLSIDYDSLPMLVKLYTVDENGLTTYLVGDATQGKPLSADLINNYKLTTLGANCYQQFTLELSWPYESGKDDFDTMLGNLSSTPGSSGVSLSLKISTTATAHSDPSAKGGIPMQGNGATTSQEYGGTIRWLWLVLLMLNAAVLIFYVAWLLNKRLADLQSAENDQQIEQDNDQTP